LAAVGWTVAVGGILVLANAGAMAAFAGLTGVLFAVWRWRVRARFTGPKIDLAHFEVE
jgi:hypothetical protein